MAVAAADVRSLLRLYRVRDWLHFLPLPLVTLDPAAPWSETVFAGVRGVASAFAVLAFGYLLNSVSDRGVDSDPHKNRLILDDAGGVQVSLAGLLVAALLLSIAAPWTVRAATVFCLISHYLYSSGPRLKAVPIVGSFANVALFAPLLCLGMRDDSFPAGFLPVAAICSALVLETQLIHEAADRLDDLRGGVRTTWLTLGPWRTALIAAGSGLTSALAAARLVPAHGLSLGIAIAAVFAVAFPLLLATRGTDPAQAARLRLAHRWTGVAMGAGVSALWRVGA
jgi:4-hydroxybenzoate polyprenyltransferase